MLKRDYEPPSDGGRSFQARYGATILRGGIAAIPTALYTYQAELQLAPQHVWFIGYILAHKWDEDLPYPSLVRMSECTGLSYRQLHRIKNDLVERELLHLVARTNTDGGKDSNAYDFGPLFGQLEEFLRRDRTPKDEEPRYQPPATPRRVVASASHTYRTSASHIPMPSETYTDRTLASYGYMTPETDGDMTLTSYDDRTSQSDGDRTGMSVEDMTAATHNKETNSRNTKNKKNESKNSNEERDGFDGAKPYSPWISGVIVDYSRELGDGANTASNVTRALRIWSRSGLDETGFVDVLQQARALTRRAQGGKGQGTITRKMAYFFTVAAELATEDKDE